MVGGGLGCAAWSAPERDADYRPGDQERVLYLEREVERLGTDLDDAEAAMLAIESGLRGGQSRADAVSALAEARIAVEDARQRAPWRAAECDQAELKLREAESQIREGNLGTAIFFASRAGRIAESVLDEARVARQASDALFVSAERVNLRSGPSVDDDVVMVLLRETPIFEEDRSGDWLLVRTWAGRVGWVYAELVGGR